MRRALILVALLLVVALAQNSVPTAAAAQYCSTPCAVSTMECNASSTCSSAPGTLTCCGAVYTCVSIDAYDQCRADCQAWFQGCTSGCTTKACLSMCNSNRVACYSTCGSRPQTSFTC